MNDDMQGEYHSPEGYMARLGIARTTLYKWMGDGTLEEGVDFVRKGRIIRFAWPPLFLADMTLRRKQALEQAAGHTDQQPLRPGRSSRKAAGEKPRSRRGRKPKTDIDAFILNKAGATPAPTGRRRQAEERRAS